MEDHDQDISDQRDNLFYAFAQDTLNRLKALIEPIGGIPNYMGYHVTFDEEAATRTIQTKKDYRKVLLHLQFQIFSKEELQLRELVQQPEPMLSQALIGYATISFNRLLFFDVILDALERYDTLDLTRDQLVETFHRYSAVWTAPTLRYETLVPLLNFRSDVQHEVHLGTHIALSPFTSEEKTQVWNSDIDFYPTVQNPIEFNAFLQAKYKLARIRYQEQAKEYSTGEVNDEVMDVLTAFRLTKAGDVGAPAIFERGELRSKGLMSPHFISRTNDYVVRQSGTEYIVTEAELLQVKSLFASLQHLDSQDQRGGLTVALRRFNQAYSREIGEDRIIDLNIALESCLLAGSREYKKKEKLSLRGATLLATRRERSVTATLLKEMYETRNHIVHGGKTLAELKKDNNQISPELTAQEFLRQAEELVRDILREYVNQMTQNNQSAQEFNKQLEFRITDTSQNK